MNKIQYEHKMRLKFNQHASRNALKKLENAIKDNEDEYIYAATGELLLWVMTTDQWHLEHGFKDYEDRRDGNENGVLINGMRHAYNMMKHNMNFFQIHQTRGGFKFPVTFPVNYKITVNWVPAGNVLEGRHRNQKRNYIQHLEGEEVLVTFNKVLTFLNKENQKHYKG